MGSSLSIGNFTIDKIFPDILSKSKESLKNKGLNLKLSTKALPETVMLTNNCHELNTYEDE